MHFEEEASRQDAWTAASRCFYASKNTAFTDDERSALQRASLRYLHSFVGISAGGSASDPPPPRVERRGEDLTDARDFRSGHGHLGTRSALERRLGWQRRR
jgi:hypothetical protein